jgi:uncharacterized protein YpmS
MSLKAILIALSAIFELVVTFFKFEGEEQKEKVETELDRSLQVAQETKDTSSLEEVIRTERDAPGRLP